MSRFLLAALLAATIAAPALANSMDDAKACVAAAQGDNNDETIRLCTVALAAGDLQPADRAVVYACRAIGYAGKNQNDKAFADFATAIKLKPDYTGAYYSRGSLYALIGQYDKAVADFDSITRLAPDFAPAYGTRSMLRFLQGQYAQGAADMAQSLKLDPNAYKILALHILRVKAGTPDADEFSKNAATVDRSKWPGPLVDLYLGKSTPEKARAAAANSDANTQHKQACEAAYYVGEYDLLHKDANAAKPLFQEAAKTCPQEFPEHSYATADLKRIGG